MNKAERKICWYSALFITLMLNSARLLALREHSIMARYWQFDVVEYAFQFLYNYFFCISLFVLNLTEGRFLEGYRQNRQLRKYYFWNGLIVFSFIVIGAFIQYQMFGNVREKNMLFRGYVVRFLFSGILAAVFIRIILLIRESKRKETLNMDLKAAYYKSQLGLLQSQLNPHFLFNSLSSLSGIIQEDPALAQHYILHLSKIFRNAITNDSSAHLVSVADELAMARSYAQLIKMRLEDAFQLEVSTDDSMLSACVPHLALQTLLENAAKHNSATGKKPLQVSISTEGDKLVVSNNMQPVLFAGDNSGMGLANLNQRCLLLMGKSLEIIRTEKIFLVKVPLKVEEK